MDFVAGKENIKPLICGRNFEHLEYAMMSSERWEEERKLHEEEIEKYDGDDPIALWYNYFYWMEQTNVSSFKPAILEQALRCCVKQFENDSRYVQDHRFIKLCVKYIDSQPSPVELYNELYNRGVGTLCAELYMGWAYYYDAVDNFSKTEEVFQKGLGAGAEPKDELEQAHKAFGFTMSQRLLHKDEYSKQKFQISLDDRRKALTSLKLSGKRHVGSIRTGLAVKSCRPGVVNQENNAQNATGMNAPSNSAIVYTDVAGSSKPGTSIVRPFSSVHSEPENIIEAARLAKLKPSSHKGTTLYGTHHAPSFDIPQDDEFFKPIPLLVDNFTRGIVLPTKFGPKNKTQTPFEVAICVGDAGERAIPMYDKIRLYCRANARWKDSERTEFSPEELRAYGYFLRHGIQNRFTIEHELVWGRGYEIGIRLHPLHVSVAKRKETEEVEFKNPTLEECDMNIQTRLHEMFPISEEEKSIEEVLVKRWLAGKINRYVDRRFQDDIDPVDMDETHVEPKRISLGAARFSMLPVAPPAEASNPPLMRQRKSIFPMHPGGLVASSIAEETEEELRNRSAINGGKFTNNLAQSARADCAGPSGAVDNDVASRKRLSNEVLEQEVSKKEDTKRTPLKTMITHDRVDKDDQAYEICSPNSDNERQTVSKKIEIFVDDSDENEEREDVAPFLKPASLDANEPQQQPYYPNDSCSTQMFNLFVKNISTPVAAIRKQQTPLCATTSTNVSTKRTVVFTDDEETDNGVSEPNPQETRPVDIERNSPCNIAAPLAGSSVVVNDENVPPSVESGTPPSTLSGCNSTQSHKQLSTIMERTESSTVSSLMGAGGTKSSVDSQGLSPKMNSPEAENDIRFHPPSKTKSIVNEPLEIPAITVENNDYKGFCIHVDSTETLANLPMLLKRQPMHVPATTTADEDKENVLVTRGACGPDIVPAAPTGRRGIFQLSEEPTCSGFGFAGTQNVSHLVQREMEAHSIASFRLATERTNTVPLQLVKPQHMIPAISTEPASSPLISSVPTGSANAVTTPSLSTVLDVDKKSFDSPKKHNSLLDLLDATFSPKVVVNTAKPDDSNGNLVPSVGEKHKLLSPDTNNFIKFSQPKNFLDASVVTDHLLTPVSIAPITVAADLSLLPLPQIKLEKSLNFDASLALPNFLVPATNKAPIERVVLDEFPSPLPPPLANERTSLEDINTAVFSLNINRAMNSTVIQDEVNTPSKQSSPFGTRENPLKIVDVKGGVSDAGCFVLPPLPKPVRETDNCKQKKSILVLGNNVPAPDLALDNETDVSIYHPRPVISQEAERWDEIGENFDSQKNEYQHKSIDMNDTQRQIEAHISANDIDPFEKQLLDAFLDRLDFMTYIEELPICQLVNKVQPLKKDVLVEVNNVGAAFKVQQKIGKGAYGTIFCAIDVSTGERVALKQERPANLWEYYICLELRSRIKNPDIVPAFMPIDYALIGNNASIFISPYSRYGNILDVCNMVNTATSRHVDEFIAMILSAQILSIVDHLHSCQIIHADIKPDNFLFISPIQLNSKIPCIQLIDFGVSIDMKLFMDDVKFKKVITTEGFTCIEMMEGKHWTYQPDLFGVAATSHVMLFGKYMQVKKNIVNWGITSAMPRYFKKAVWENYFTTLLNIRDCDHLPNLQNLRSAFMEEVTLHEKYIQSKIVEFNNVLATCK